MSKYKPFHRFEQQDTGHLPKLVRCRAKPWQPTARIMHMILVHSAMSSGDARSLASTASGSLDTLIIDPLSYSKVRANALLTPLQNTMNGRLTSMMLTFVSMTSRWLARSPNSGATPKTTPPMTPNLRVTSNGRASTASMEQKTVAGTNVRYAKPAERTLPPRALSIEFKIVKFT